MTKGGRRKHPDLMALEGGRGRKQSNSPRPEPVTEKNWRTPKWLPKYAKEFVKRYRAPLEKTNVLTSWDYDAFLFMACIAHEIKDHVEVMAKDGYVLTGRGGGIVKHPRASMLKAATQQFRLYASEFGLTPKGRCGLDVSPKVDDDGEWDGLSPRMKDLID
jgi:P27 family predicted phage terminase small subunit